MSQVWKMMMDDQGVIDQWVDWDFIDLLDT